jgi:multiple sugar transport system substrate-binding protein
MSFYNRRRFLTTTAGAAGSLAVASVLGTPVFGQDKARIRHYWWGNPERDKRTFAVIDIFNGKNSNIEVVGETVGFADYFPKLATQIAGGSMPDVIQMGYGVMFEYIANGSIVPLDDYVGKSLDVSKIDQAALDAGTVDGKLYAVSIGANSHVAMYNTAAYAKAGIEPGKGFDPFGWTYDDLKRIGAEVTKANEGKIAGTDDNTANYQNFSDWVGQNGVAMFDDDKNYAVPQELVEQYWAMWADIRASGATPPARASAGLVNAEMAKWGVVVGNSATYYGWSNQMVGAQALMTDKLGAAMYPNTPAMVPGSIVQPSQFVCLTRDSKSTAEATSYMSAFVNDLDMTAVLGLERGIPSQTDVRNALLPKLTEAEATTVAFFDGIRGKTAVLPPPPPAGANEIEQTFQRMATGLLLDQDDIPNSAAQFLRQAAFIRKRAG